MNAIGVKLITARDKFLPDWC